MRSMKLRKVCSKVYDYIRYDLKEIAFPSSLPDPPHIKKRRKLTWVERWLILKEASRLYAASWVRDIGPDLRPNAYKKKQNDNDDQGRNASSKNVEPSMLEDLAVAARGGMETLRPALQRIYMIRASAYRDALKSFIQGYQEGVKSVMDKSDNANLKMQDDALTKHESLQNTARKPSPATPLQVLCFLFALFPLRRCSGLALKIWLLSSFGCKISQAIPFLLSKSGNINASLGLVLCLLRLQIRRPAFTSFGATKKSPPCLFEVLCI